MIQRPKGTEDILPSEVYKWRFIEKTAERIAAAYGFTEIRFPVFEYTELFTRSVGDTTDVVTKEMYTFSDKGGRSITLRPEGTAGAVRAALQNGLLSETLPQKVWYNITAYRYENVQKGRQREFHQIGAEMFGAGGYFADAEVIAFAADFIAALGLRDIALEINSIGCPECRKNYTAALRTYFEKFTDKLCATCNERLVKNPMRILDCKSPVCKEIAAGAPLVSDFLCDDCNTHFDGLKTVLDSFGIPYKVNPHIVRGLDYYTRTVFEFISEGVGTQGTVCGGGRYDRLIEEIGGKPTPALGFAMGIERLLLALKEQNVEIPKPPRLDYYIGAMDEESRIYAAGIVRKLRSWGYIAESDLMERGVKPQMKYADKLGAKFSFIIGENEMSSGKIRLKKMETGETTELSIGDLKNFALGSGEEDK
ncbi:MAG: histidine--tRNA ligase [Ruminococcus sp.]|nr:histidine--tRNA ligase [Ruminococcus sp.]